MAANAKAVTGDAGAKHQNKAVMRVVYVGLFAALSYVVFTFLQIKIYVGADATSFHLGNAVVAIGALLIGGFWGGLGGAIGMTIGDLLDPVYVVYAPKTFICKLLIGLVTGLGGNGDSKSFRLTQTMIANLVANFGFDISEEDVLSKNVAAVTYSAEVF